MTLPAYRLGTTIFTDGCLCGIRAMATAGPFDWCLIGQYSCPNFDGVQNGRLKCTANTQHAAQLAVLAEAYARQGDRTRAAQADAVTQSVLAHYNPPGCRFWTHRRVLALRDGQIQGEQPGGLRVAWRPLGPTPPMRNRAPGNQWRRRRDRRGPLGPVPPYQKLDLEPTTNPSIQLDMGPEEQHLKFVAPSRMEDYITDVFFDLLEEQREREQVAPGDPIKRPLSTPFIKTPFVTPGRPESNPAHRFQTPQYYYSTVITPRSWRPLVQVTALHLLAHDTRAPELLNALRRQFPRTAERLLLINLIDAWGQLPVRLQAAPDVQEISAMPRRMVRGEKGLQRLENYVNWYVETRHSNRGIEG